MSEIKNTEEVVNALENLAKMRASKNKQELTLSTVRKKNKKVDKPKLIEEESAKPKLGIMQKMKQSQEKETIKKDEINKKQLLAKLEQIYRDKIIGGNQLLQSIVPKFVNILTELHKKDNPSLYEGTDSIKFKEERMAKRHMRANSQSQLDTKIMQRLQWLQMDIRSSFEDKLALVQGLDTNNVEIITKVSYYNDKVEYETEEGIYEFSVEEAQKFGGYVIQQVRILTEELKLHNVLKGLGSNTPDIANKHKNLFWLMFEPFIGFTSDGRILLMNTDHLTEAMHDHYRRRVANGNFDAKTVDAFQESRKALFLSDRKIIEYIDRNLEIPKTSMAVLFPYHLMSKSGVEFELKYKVKSSESISEVFLPQNIVRFVNYEKAKLSDETTETYLYYRKSLLQVEKLYTKMIKASTKQENVKVDSPNIQNKKDESGLTEEQLLLKEMMEDMEESNRDYMTKQNKESTIHKAIKKDLENEKREEEEANQKEYEDEEDILESLSIKTINYVALDKEFKDILDHFNEFKPSKISEIGLVINEYIDTDIDLVSILMMVIKNMGEIEVNIKKIHGFIEEINPYAGEERLVINNKITQSLIESTRDLEPNIKYAEDLLMYFKDIKRKYQSVNSAMFKNIPIALSNLDATITSDRGYPINLAPMIIDRLLTNPKIYYEVDEAGLYPRPIINRPKKMMYSYVREMVKFFIQSETEVINWLELLKLMVPESVSYLSQIRECPELIQLTQCEKIVPLLRLVNRGERNKIRKVDENTTWEDVRDRTSVYLPPLTESETKLNFVLKNVFDNYKGFICAIDFEGLINYIINLDDIDTMEGKEIVKYIPLPSVVNNQFYIHAINPQYPKLSEDLFKEVRTVPAVVIALQHLLTTGRDYLDSYKSTDDFGELEDMAIEYGVQRKKIFDKNPKKHSYTVNSTALRVEELNIEYKKLDELLINTYNKDFGRVELDLQNYKGFSEYKVKLDEYAQGIETLNPAMYKEITRLSLDLNNVLKVHENSIRHQLQDTLTNMDEQVKYSLEIIKKHKESIMDRNVDYIDNTMKLFHSHYDSDKSYQGLINSLSKLKLDYIPNIGVLVNLIKSIAEELPEPLTGAFIKVADDFIKNLKHIEDSNPFKTPKSRALTIVQIFNVITEAMGVNSPLSPSSTDIDAIEKRLQEEQDKEIEDNKPDMTEEEKEILMQFVDSLETLDDYNIPDIVKGFHRKDLIPNTLYEDWAYPSRMYHGTGYEDLYSDDFSLAENLKLRLELGYKLKQEHLEDWKLMESVGSIILDEKFLESLREENIED